MNQLLVLIAFLFSSSLVFAQANTAKNSQSRLFAEIDLTTDYREKGITQTEKGIALQSDLGYQYSSGRIGVWGSNVKYASSTDEYLNLRPYLSFRIDTSTNSNINLRYDFNRYYSSSTRNGSIITIDINLFGYHVIYQQQEKWEGTDTTSTWYGFSKTWNQPSAFTYDTTVGYSMVGSGYNNFFDTRVAANYRAGDFVYSLINTYNSGSSQFNGRADLAFIFQVGANF